MIAVLTDPGVGGTFLTWSLHYLAGHTEYFYIRNNSLRQLPNNPLNVFNAHNFKSNQFDCYSDLTQYLSNFDQHQLTQFTTVYFHNLKEVPFSKEFLDTKKAIEFIKSFTKKIIVLTNQSKNHLYGQSYRKRLLGVPQPDGSIKHVSNEQHLEDFITEFFQDSYTKWKELKLVNVWDQREFLALNARNEAISIAPHIDLSIEHYDIDCMEWFNIGDSIMIDLFDKLNIKLDPDRFESWQNIYQTWRKIHYNRLNFMWCFDKIVDYIVKGYYLDLTRLDLDIVQEAFIQHELIYKHNLNLKTFQLEKFTDTQQLHLLLEPNTHTLSTY